MKPDRMILKLIEEVESVGQQDLLERCDSWIAVVCNTDGEQIIQTEERPRKETFMHMELGFEIELQISMEKSGYSKTNGGTVW